MGTKNQFNPTFASHTAFGRDLETEKFLVENGIVFLEDKPYESEDSGYAYQYAKREILRLTHSDVNWGELGAEKPIRLFINTNGGPLSDAMALYDMITFLIHDGDGLEIETIVQGNAYSAGAIILQAGSKRKATPHSVIMVHNASGGNVGDPRDMEIFTEIFKKQNNDMMKMFAEKTGMTLTKFKKIIDGKDTYFTAQEALKIGLIDEIVE